MKVAHYAIVTPRRCGLYETTRELVANLRKMGVDSRIIDPKPIGERIEKDDRGAKMASPEWAEDADILVSHSGLGDKENCGKPIIYVAHGRPRHSFLNEAQGSTPIYSYLYSLNQKKQFKAIVTFWPEHVPYLQVMCDTPVHYVQPSVDLDFWRPEKPDYDFAQKKGGVNVVCADSFRNDGDCYDCINAYALWANKNKHLNPKLHIFGFPGKERGWAAMFRRLQDQNIMGIVQTWAAELQRVYNAADLVLTPHKIDVRTVREATACGCPVVRIDRPIEKMDEPINYALTKDRSEIRKEAEFLFNPSMTASQFKEILCNI
jgi:glycosyltransferase involved in cell wall biosynthesis